MKMEELKNDIKDLRRQTWDEASFIPEVRLLGLMTRERLRAACEDYLNPAHREDIIDRIYTGARKVFAILVTLDQPELIINFFRHDQFQSRLDHSLPFQPSLLEKILPPRHSVTDFDERQWEFCPLYLSESGIRRSLRKRTVLPFIHNEKVAEGGFGTAYDVAIDDASHGLDRVGSRSSGPLRVIRKQIQSHVDDHETELQNLLLLKLLRHPCIVRLLSAYSLKHEHNLLFEKACDGDLDNLITHERSPSFENDETLLIALVGLTSAIHNVHDYSAHEYDLSLIGCHHDVKLKNVLVDGDRFLLADFGLSRFKLQSDGSTTPYRIRGGYEIAPECQSLDEDQDDRFIHRSSDIWSLGCIIAYILVYMKRGPAGIESFKKARKFGLRQKTLYYFHCGDKENEKMHAWLRELEAECALSERMLMQLVRAILVLAPEQRPSAGDVTAALKFVALQKLAQGITRKFESIDTKVSADQARTELSIEAKRFLSWQWSLGLIENDQHPTQSFKLLDGCQDFEGTVASLTELQQVFANFAPSFDNILRRLVLPIRQLNSSLSGFLHIDKAASAKDFLETELLRTNSLEFLSSLAQYNSVDGMNDIFETKQKTLRIQSGDRISEVVVEMSLESGTIDQLDDIKHGNAADDIQYNKHESILIEWKGYDDPVRRESLKPRIQAIASLLHSIPSNPRFRNLQCQGYHHNVRRPAFGLVYSVPRADDVGQTHIQTLQDYLQKGEYSRRYRPSLGDRFQLAHNIVLAILEFHKVSWFHRSLSASNVIFVCGSRHPRSLALANPWIVGFMHSRPNEETAFTEGPGPNADDKDYSHPDYLENDRRFEPWFDYYSLGLILFEIGVWKSLHAMTEKGGTPREMLIKLSETWTPDLRMGAGVEYTNCVQVCLDGSLAIPSVVSSGEAEQPRAEEDRNAAAYMRFSTQVVQVLARLAEYSI